MRRTVRSGLALFVVAVGVVAPAGAAHADLLNAEQQERCFVEHREEDAYAEYSYRWMGEDVYVYLECGTERWGYTHIMNRHRAKWQAQLDAGRAAGWQPEALGIRTWDDLMNAAVRAAVERPQVRNIYMSRPKGCGIVELSFAVAGPEAPPFRFAATAVWATDYGSIISAYPSTKTRC